MDAASRAARRPYTDAGHELKTFNVQDDQGIKSLQRPGFPITIVTCRAATLAPYLEQQ
jgi:3-deoxy-D-manno-octulosonate 8-phosphate phosphatase KdsC-like HAD superfamily phosphatase